MITYKCITNLRDGKNTFEYGKVYSGDMISDENKKYFIEQKEIVINAKQTKTKSTKTKETSSLDIDDLM